LSIDINELIVELDGDDEPFPPLYADLLNDVNLDDNDWVTYLEEGYGPYIISLIKLLHHLAPDFSKKEKSARVCVEEIRNVFGIGNGFEYGPMSVGSGKLPS